MTPSHWLVCYHLARFAAQLEKLEEARDWLSCAGYCSGRYLALDESDLAPIREFVDNMGKYPPEKAQHGRPNARNL